MPACIHDSAKIKAQITELAGEAEAIQALAQQEGRDASDAEAKRFDAIVAQLGDPEARTGLYASLDTAERFEKIRAAQGRPANKMPPPALAAQQADEDIPARVRHVMPQLKAFRDARSAHESAQWLLATFRGDEDAKAFCSRNGLAIRAAATEGTNSAGGFLVPDPLSSAIQQVVRIYGVASRMGCRMLPMTSDTLNVPKRSAGGTVYYPGEAAAITASDKTWASVALSVVKRATLHKVSTELTQDAAINVADDLAMEIGLAFGLQRDNELINGDGTGTYGSETGLVSAIHSNAVTELSGASQTAFSNTDMADIHTLVSTLPEQFQPGSSFLMLRSTWDAVVVPLILAAGGALTSDFGQGVQPTLLGKPVYFSDHMPASGAAKFVMFLGQWRNAVMIGERSAISIQSSSDYAFNEDVLTFRATTRYDINVHSTGLAAADRAYVGLKTDAS